MSGSDEMFTLVDGKKTDAQLHEPILAAGRDDMTAIRARARKMGLSETAIDRLYPTTS